MCKCRRARCSDCVSGRATGRVNIIKKKKGVVKQSIAHRRSPWLCQPLWRRKHFNSPLSSICACGGSHGCRRPLFITTDRSQICWFAELWEEDGGGGNGGASIWRSGRWSRPDGGGNLGVFPTAAVDSFTPAWFPPTRVHSLRAVQTDPYDNLTSGTSPPTAGMWDENLTFLLMSQQDCKVTCIYPLISYNKV